MGTEGVCIAVHYVVTYYEVPYWLLENANRFDIGINVGGYDGRRKEECLFLTFIRLFKTNIIW
jgi:hypothetical protein